MPSLRRTITVLFGFVINLPLAILGVAIYLSVLAGVNENVENKNETLAKAAEEAVRQSLADGALLLASVTEARAAYGETSGAAFLESALVRTGIFEAVQILDAAGRVLLQLPGADEYAGLDMSRQPYFTEARRSPSFPFISSSFRSAFSGNPTAAIVLPAEDGYAVGFINLEWLSRLIRAMNFGRDGYVAVADRNGTLIAHRHEERVAAQENISYLPLYPWARDQKRGTARYEIRGEARIGSIGFVDEAGWILIVSEPVIDAYAPARKVALIAALGVLAALALAVTGSTALARSILNAFNALVDDAGRLATGDYSSIRMRSPYSEINALIESLNAMAGSVAERERSLVAAKDELASALGVKETLLREIHHRVKNNMQIMSSLLALQEGKLVSDADRAVFEESRIRIQSMAMVHEKMYQSEGVELVPMREYLGDLAAGLLELYPNDDVALNVEGDQIELDLVRAVPCALAVFEACANALKHGIAGRGAARVTIRLESARGRASISVCDDGPGFPAGFDPSNSDSLGFQLMGGLAEQLRGELSWSNAEGGGAVLSIRFPLHGE